MAQLWQTPGAGEEVVSGMLALPTEDLVAGLTAGGASPELAAQEAGHIDELMASCILALYRSAITVGDEWEDAVAAMPSLPVLVLWGGDDPYVAPEVAGRLAQRVDGELLVFDGCSHWWPCERAQETADALERFWRNAR